MIATEKHLRPNKNDRQRKTVDCVFIKKFLLFIKRDNKYFKIPDLSNFV